MEFKRAKHEYRSQRRILPRHHKPEEVIEIVANHMEIDKDKVHVKYKRQYTKLRAISCFLMSCYCNMNQRDICGFIGNIAQTRVSKLSLIGMDMISSDKDLLEKFLKAV